MLSIPLQRVAGSSNVFRPSMRYVDKQGQAESRRTRSATTHTNNTQATTGTHNDKHLHTTNVTTTPTITTNTIPNVQPRHTSVH